MTISDAGAVLAAGAAEHAALVATIADYYLGWFDGDAARIARALHPNLVKRAWLRDEPGGQALDAYTFESMVAFTREGRGRRGDPAERAYEIRAVEIHDDIASACVYAVPYVDYLHFVRTDDGWRIVHALWRRP